MPARCSEVELMDLIRGVTEEFSLEMPRSSNRKCRGYAFVCTAAHIMPRLAGFLYQRQVPTRQSSRALKIHPAGFETERSE